MSCPLKQEELSVQWQLKFLHKILQKRLLRSYFLSEVKSHYDLLNKPLQTVWTQIILKKNQTNQQMTNKIEKVPSLHTCKEFEGKSFKSQVCCFSLESSLHFPVEMKIFQDLVVSVFCRFNLPRFFK